MNGGKCTRVRGSGWETDEKRRKILRTDDDDLLDTFAVLATLVLNHESD
jgi:hypothetical protein